MRPCSRLAGLLLSSLLLSAAAQAQGTVSAPPPPDQQWQPLFQQVQGAHLFKDQKTFADAVPRQPAATVLTEWQRARTQPGFDLAAFVAEHFTVPGDTQPYVPPAGETLRAHIDGLWPVLTRTTGTVDPNGSLLPLPKPYVVPGGRFREVYYWDSYFTLLGLASSGRWQQVRDMVDNFAFQLDSYGHIPNATAAIT